MALPQNFLIHTPTFSQMAWRRRASGNRLNGNDILNSADEVACVEEESRRLVME